MSKLVSRIPGVEIKSLVSNGITGMTQRVVCSECSGHLDIGLSNGGVPFPEEFVFKKARQNGWVPHKKGKHVCSKCKHKEADMADTEPRVMQPADKRAIFRRVDECYDDKNLRYCDEFTDAIIARELGVPRKWVTDVREDSFGPSGENADMARLSSNLGKAQAELTDAINSCLEAASKAEELKKTVDGLRGDLDKIKTAVGPYRAA